MPDQDEAVSMSTRRLIQVPQQHLTAITGRNGQNFARLEEVHGIKIIILPLKDGDHLQEICIEGTTEGPSRCGDAANEVEKVILSLSYIRTLLEL